MRKEIKETSYKVCEVTPKQKIIHTFFECKNIENARVLKKRQLKHLVESGLIEGTVIILDNENRIVN